MSCGKCAPQPRQGNTDRLSASHCLRIKIITSDSMSVSRQTDAQARGQAPVAKNNEGDLSVAVLVGSRRCRVEFMSLQMLQLW